LLGEYSIDLWKRQTELILAKRGMVSFIVHPDYVQERRAMQVYDELLHYLDELRAKSDLWFALPSEVNR